MTENAFFFCVAIDICVSLLENVFAFFKIYV